MSPEQDKSDVAPAPLEDRWVDELVPEGFDWRVVVHEHPRITLAVAAIAGFVVGRFHGPRIVAAASVIVQDRVQGAVEEATGAFRERAAATE